MSARAEELRAALKDDQDLQAKLVAATTDAERKQVFADAGYSDVSAADARATANPSGELSEDELAAASGAGGSSDSLDPPDSQKDCEPSEDVWRKWASLHSR